MAGAGSLRVTTTRQGVAVDVTMVHEWAGVGMGRVGNGRKAGGRQFLRRNARLTKVRRSMDCMRAGVGRWIEVDGSVTEVE